MGRRLCWRCCGRVSDGQGSRRMAPFTPPASRSTPRSPFREARRSSPITSMPTKISPCLRSVGPIGRACGIRPRLKVASTLMVSTRSRGMDCEVYGLDRPSRLNWSADWSNFSP